MILAGALCGAVWGCYSIVRDYQKSPLVVSYFVQVTLYDKSTIFKMPYKPQEADSMYVPDVIVCPFNRFNSTFLDAYNVSQEVREVCCGIDIIQCAGASIPRDGLSVTDLT